MKQNSYFFSALLLTAIFLLTQSNIVRAQLNSAGTYVWNATDAPKVFNNKLQLSFVSNAQGFQSYGTVLAGGGYTSSQDGAAFQIYFPYSPTYGGVAPQIRFGRYDNQGWSSWNTFFTSANANLPTTDWVTKNLTAYGNILIGKTSQTNPSYKLDVNGNIRANKVVVNTTGADFVFDSSYSLLQLDSVNNYIRKNRHLPGIAPASEMQSEGIDVGENQTRLLQKIEELTLYIIQLNKGQIDLSKKIHDQSQRIAELEKKKNEDDL